MIPEELKKFDVSEKQQFHHSRLLFVYSKIINENDVSKLITGELENIAYSATGQTTKKTIVLISMVSGKKYRRTLNSLKYDKKTIPKVYNIRGREHWTIAKNYIKSLRTHDESTSSDDDYDYITSDTGSTRSEVSSVSDFTSLKDQKEDISISSDPISVIKSQIEEVKSTYKSNMDMMRTILGKSDAETTKDVVDLIKIFTLEKTREINELRKELEKLENK